MQLPLFMFVIPSAPFFLYFKSEEDWGEYKYGVGVEAKGEDKEIKEKKKQYAHLISFFFFFEKLFFL